MLHEIYDGGGNDAYLLFCVNFYVPHTTTLMLLVNNVMPPKKMQCEIIYQPTTSAIMRYIALK